MTLVNIFEAKAQLSDLLERASSGERILICKRNQPIVELRPVAAARKSPRPFGGARGVVGIRPAFFEPLPSDEIEAFETPLAFPATTAGVSRVAESDAPVNARVRRRGRAVKRR